jgi:spore germination cell wall hydrolase CwlJ-like protein
MAVYFEARSESLEGQLAVANTIINRVQSDKFPSTSCEVTKQARYIGDHPIRNQCHFSYWCDGKLETINDQDAYVLALSIAIWANLRLVDITDGAVFYHRDDVQPYWSAGLDVTRKIGRHIFYSD